MGKKTFTSLENCTNLFTALTEFRREALQKFEPVRKNKAYMKKGVFDAEKYFTQLLKKHNIDRNYINHVKEVLHKDELIPRTFLKWNDQKDKPNMEMAARVAEEATHKLSAYQREWRNRKKAKTPEESDKLPEESTCVDIFSGLSDDDLIEELRRRHPKAKSIHVEYEY